MVVSRWIVCGAAFLAHLLSTGLQLAYGALHVYALRHLGPSADHAGKYYEYLVLYLDEHLVNRYYYKD